MPQIQFRIQGIIGLKKDGEGLVVGIPDTSRERDFQGIPLRKHEPMLAFSFRRMDFNGYQPCVPHSRIVLTPGTRISASVTSSDSPPPPSGAVAPPRIVELFPDRQRCPWDSSKLMFPSFSLPPGALEGWDGQGHGTMVDVQGNPIGRDLAVGATWTMRMPVGAELTLEIEQGGRRTKIVFSPGATVWLLNHPVAHHQPPRPRQPEQDFAWYYWFLDPEWTGALPLPMTPDDAPEIGDCAPPVASTGGQLCRPCEFCPD